MFRKPVKQKGKEAKENGSNLAAIDHYEKAFVSYNIERIREVISRLSPEKQELFHTIPFLIHINSPDFPGYTDHPISAYGIYSFHDSGFWREALKNLKFREKDMLPYLASTYIIRGLYLIGGIGGSLVHEECSSFDYWVVVDGKKSIDIHLSLLKKKLAKIIDWSLKEFNQKINFIVLKDGEIRRNTIFSGGQVPLWPEQTTILKEEFYRTFIMIAGQVPVWAVLPSGIDDEDYLKNADVILKKNSGHAADSLYIDLGNPGSIIISECPGAILWQLYKAKYDPVKSFICASLIASYYYEENVTLPCNSVKLKYTESELTDCVIFSETAIFDNVLKFYKKRSSDKLYDLAKQTIYLIVHRHTLLEQHDGETPFTRLLHKLVSKWEWGDEKIEHLKQFDRWPEEKKLAFDEKIIESIGELYRDVAISMTSSGLTLPVHPSELQVVKNKISGLFQQKKNKIPTSSAYLKAKADAGALKILCRRDMRRRKEWSCHEYIGVDSQYDVVHSVFRVADPLQVIGWILANQLAGNREDSIIFEDETGKPAPHVKELFKKAQNFLIDPDDYSDGIFQEDPEYDRLFIAVNSKSDEELLQDASMLIQNSWKEIFYIPLDIKHIENMMLQCYKIGKVISNFYLKTTPRNLQYAVFHNKTDDNEYVNRTVKEFVNQFKSAASETFETNNTEINSHELEDVRPFLDTL